MAEEQLSFETLKVRAGYKDIFLLVMLLLMCGCHHHQFKIGVTSSPHLASLFLAEKSGKWDKNSHLVNFPTSADVGYALISGKIDAGFMEPNKALLIKEIRELKDIKVIGKITYKYGGGLIVRKGLDLDLHHLNGHTIGISEPECKLYHALLKDIEYAHDSTAGIRFQTIPFADMIPAIEAGRIDAAITKSSYGAYAKKLGMTIPYSQWNITAGDACCPAVTAQCEFLLLGRKEKANETDQLSRLLLETTKESDAVLRQAAAEKTGISGDILESLPVAAYDVADNKLLQLFITVDEKEKKE